VRHDRAICEGVRAACLNRTRPVFELAARFRRRDDAAGPLAVSLAGLLLDPRVITGAPAWLKPIKFAISISIYFAERLSKPTPNASF
jgi:hypothetical protein